MQTRRDRLQAYQYLVRRILAALLGNEPESPEQPMRRVKTAMFSGIMVGALACGGVAFYGWVSHMGARGWQKDGQTIIQVKETGAQYYWDGELLRPITNYTSAKLILGEDLQIRDIARASLVTETGEDVPRGPEVGLRDVPPDLPEAEQIENGRWSVCNHVTTVEDKQTGTERDLRLVDVIVNKSVTGTPLGEDDALLVSLEPTEETYLIWNGTRLEADDDALRSLGMTETPPVRVFDTWLNAIPPASPLAPERVGDIGASALDVGDYTDVVVGQVFLDSNNDYHIMTEEGLVGISETQARLILGSDELSVNEGGRPTDVSVADTSQVAADDAQPVGPEDQPSEVPELVTLEDGADTPVCLHYNSTEPEELLVSVGAEVPAAAEIQPIEGFETGRLANRVTVPGGTVSLIRAVGNPGTDGTLYIVTDSGKKYPIPNEKALAKLEYTDVKPMPLPSAIADMLRSGEALDPAKALTPVIGQETEPQGDG